MDHRINPGNLPLCIKRLAEEGFTINVESSKRFIRITCEGNALKNLIPSGHNGLIEFGG